MHLVISPAFARDYKSAAEAEKAFHANVDFRNRTITVPGTYCNKRDIETYYPGSSVEIRFNKLEDLTVVQL